MRKRTLTIIVGLIVTLGFGLAATIYLDGFFLPNKPCRLVKYPNTQRTAQPFEYVVTMEIGDILAFYDESLPVKLWPANTGLWSRQELSPTAFLYACYGTDINHLSTETGCIYIRQRTEGSVEVTGMLLRSEGSNAQCPLN